MHEIRIRRIDAGGYILDSFDPRYITYRERYFKTLDEVFYFINYFYNECATVKQTREDE